MTIATSRRELTKDYMLNYVLEYGDSDDKAWFKDTIKDCTVERNNKLIGDYTDVNLAQLRDAFIEYFKNDFGMLSTGNSKNFLDKVNELL